MKFSSNLENFFSLGRWWVNLKFIVFVQSVMLSYRSIAILGFAVSLMHPLNPPSAEFKPISPVRPATARLGLGAINV